MKISYNLYLVGSGQFGMQLSDLKDCNVYLVDCGEEAVLIDAGGGVRPQAILSNIEQSGIPLERITHILLTHVHGDHAAGAFYFQNTYGWKVIVSEEAAPWLEQGDRDKTSLNQAIEAGVYARDFSYPACPVAGTVQDGDELRIGSFTFRVIDTPGHSRGHVSYLWEKEGKRSLFSGDVIFAGGKIVLQNTWDCVIQDYARSIARLHGLKIDALYPGHGPFLNTLAWKHIEMAHEKFVRLDIPPNL